jgi:glycosyltransferase involved in cell wall biosynthesis
MQLAVRFVLRRADAIIAVGKAHAELIGKITAIRSEKMHVIDPGIQLPENSLTKHEARLELGVEQGTRMVLFIGNLIHSKGPDILIEAFAKLDVLGPCNLFMVGQGRMLDSLHDMARRNGIQNHVFFIGPVPHEEVYCWLYAADVVAAPARREPFGLLQMEALACGAPLVTSNTGELSRNLQHMQHALLVPVEDPQLLAQALKRIIEDEPLAKSLSDEGRKLAAGYSVEKKASEVLELYRQVVETARVQSGLRD